MKEVNNIPKHWQVKKLGDIFTIERGGSPRPIENYITKDVNGINWIKIGDTKEVVKYIYQTKEKIIPEGAKRSRMVFEDDFLLSNSMSFGRPYIMKTKGCIHDGWLVIRKNDKIDNNYLYYILSSSSLFQQFTKLAKGSTVKNLNIEAVKQATIQFPPLSEQQAIVSKIEELLSDLENGKQQLQTALQQLKVYRQSLLKAAFEGIKYSEIISVEDCCTHIVDCLHSTAKFSSSGYYCVDTTCIENGKILFEKVRYVDSEVYQERISRLKPMPGDILFAREGTVGTTLIVPDKIDLCLGQRMMMFRLKKEISPKYFMYYFQSSAFKSQYQPMIMGTTAPHLNIRDTRKFNILICPYSEQLLIVSELESKLTICDKIEETISQSLQQAETLRQSILKKAFEGRLV